MTYAELRRWVRTPKGQAAVLGALLLAAVPLALAIALNRPFFERHVVEKYEPAPSVAVVELATAISAGKQGVEAVRKRSAEERDGLYAVWMTSTEGHERLPRVLVEADPVHYRQRLERTFAAGSQSQQERAAAFALAARHPALLPTLEWAERRSARLGRQQVKEAVTRAIQSMVQSTDTR